MRKYEYKTVKIPASAASSYSKMLTDAKQQGWELDSKEERTINTIVVLEVKLKRLVR